MRDETVKAVDNTLHRQLRGVALLDGCQDVDNEIIDQHTRTYIRILQVFEQDKFQS